MDKVGSSEVMKTSICVCALVLMKVLKLPLMCDESTLVYRNWVYERLIAFHISALSNIDVYVFSHWQIHLKRLPNT